MADHALLSPSKATQWTSCFGAVAMQQPFEDKPSAYAEEGTRAHLAAAAILEGRTIDITRCDEEMLEHVMLYTDLVQSLVTEQALLFVEQRLQFSEAIGVEDSFGTADAVIIEADRITLVDLKYGMGVRVDAVKNAQLMLYAIAAIEQFGMAHDIKRVRLIIVQPRLDHVTEWEIPVEELEPFRIEAHFAAQKAIQCVEAYPGGQGMPLDMLNPSEAACRWCKAKAVCPALANFVMSSVADDWVDLDKDIEPQLGSAIELVKAAGPEHLGRCLAAIPLIEDWCSAVRGAVESELLAGRPVPGFKLVQGRQGQRKWTADDAPVEILEKALGEAAFSVELISPTAAEKALKASPSTWKELQAFITRSDGKPSVAPISDKRPAITAAAEAGEFSPITDD
jgi:hypothetical protein